MLTEASARRLTDIQVDAHVHIYPFMSVAGLLDAASRNLSGAGASAGGCCVLFIADPQGVAGFARLLAHGGHGPAAGWTREDGDARSVTFRGSGGTRIMAIKGQQLISREGLEVLGIGYKQDLASGLPLAQTVERIRAAGGWSVIAWGAGKWLGRRGRTVTNLIHAEAGRRDVMLADNGGRPWCWSRVSQFEAAAETGMRVLAGTDPLPLQGEENRVGSYGVQVRIERASDRSLVDSFCEALEQPETSVRTIGRPMGVGRFISNQLRLRLRAQSGQRSP